MTAFRRLASSQMRILTIVEAAGFGAVTLGFGLMGHVLAGIEAAIASASLIGGISLVYLANAYAFANAGTEEGSDAERP